jgi:hypothetical protein
MTKPDRVKLNMSTRCACGEISIRVVGETLSMLMCACLDCQRSTGTGHATVVVVPTEALTIEGPVKAFSRPSNSGATFTRHFCPECGTPIFGQSSRAPTMRMLLAGTFAGQNGWYAPNQMIFGRTKQDWDLFDDHLPVHDTYRA